MMKKVCFLGLFLLLLAMSVNSVGAITLNFNGFIADEANLLPDSVENDLNMTLWDLQKKSGADLVVVTLPTLNGKSVESVALDIGRSYKLGAVGKNNGMVFLTAPNERRMRIELGTGLENKISMKKLEEIRDYDILPYYKKNDYKNGITRGTYLLVNAIAEVENVSVKTQGYCPSRTSNSGSSSRNDSDLPFWAYPFIILAALFSPRSRRFTSGSFGGFGGGGGFGGSGCSGSW